MAAPVSLALLTGLSLAERRAAGLYPFGPAPADLEFGLREPERPHGINPAVRAVLAREQEEWGQRDRQARGLAVVDPRAALVTTSSNVAGRSPAGLDAGRMREVIALAMGGAEKLQRDREARRERYRLRRAHQRTLEVRTEERGEKWTAEDAGEPAALAALVAELRQAGTAPREWAPHLGPWAEGERATAARCSSGGVRGVRVGQLLCGRAAAIETPARGAHPGKGAKLGKTADVEVRRAPDGRAGASGLYYCGAVWSCPVCSWHIARERGEEVQRVYRLLCEQGGPALHPYFLTLTVRHGADMPLERTREAVAECWRKIRQARGWRQWQERLGYYGDVRALEVTHGANGWHPHLHVVLFSVREIPTEIGREFTAWLLAEWRKRVGAALGVEPNEERGVQMERVRSRADYVAKLGIGAELSSAHGKKARKEGSRTTWQLLQDVARRCEAGDYGHRDVALWREWVEGMHGARQLTWGGELRALRKVMGEDELTDEQAAAAEVERGAVVARVPVETWTKMESRLPDFAPAALEAAESGGGAAVVMLVRRLVEWYSGGEGDGEYGPQPLGPHPTGPPPWWGGNITSAEV